VETKEKKTGRVPNCGFWESGFDPVVCLEPFNSGPHRHSALKARLGFDIGDRGGQNLRHLLHCAVTTHGASMRK